jgi:hypothetical protein
MRWLGRSKGFLIGRRPRKPEIVVYTAIIGDFDTLREPHIRTDAIQYVCFTDNPQVNADGWEIVEIERSDEHPRLQQRQYKILSHRFFPNDDVTLYVDGNLELLVDPFELRDRFLRDADLALFEHPERDGVYAELRACADLGKDDPSTLSSVAEMYRFEGMPEHGFLHAAGFILRRHTQPIVRFNETWHRELRRTTFRDQPALAHTLWKSGLQRTTIHENIWNNRFLRYHPHKANEADN